jgi:hypothetical protein
MENLIMVSILIPLFEAMTQNQQVAYRTVCLVPAMLALVTGVFLHRTTDDTPRGKELQGPPEGCGSDVGVEEAAHLSAGRVQEPEHLDLGPPVRVLLRPGAHSELTGRRVL